MLGRGLLLEGSFELFEVGASCGKRLAFLGDAPVAAENSGVVSIPKECPDFG